MKNTVTCLFFLIVFVYSIRANETPAGISVSAENIQISAGFLSKALRLEKNLLVPQKFLIGGQNLSSDGSYELSFRIMKASPNEEPVGVEKDPNVEIRFMQGLRKTPEVRGIWESVSKQQNVTWTDPLSLKSNEWNDIFKYSHCVVSTPHPGVTRLNVRFASAENETLPRLSVNIFYEVYEGYPVIRKWVEITNNGPLWLKVDELILDGLDISSDFNNVTDLTPADYGACASTRSYGNADHSRGLIVASEVPSALRTIKANGTNGYSSEYFEWVIGPTESFTSDPVFHYGYDGKTIQTISASSTELDRIVESRFKDFLYERVGILRVNAELFAPVWCSWTNFRISPTHDDVVAMADIAKKCGFRSILVDDTGRGFTATDYPKSILPEGKQFPDFHKTAEEIRARGMSLGLWLACYRRPDFDPDFTEIPDYSVYPRVKRDKWVAMSYASPWRYYYAHDLLELCDQYDIIYYKQDFSNPMFGDIAKGHDSRTLKESYLRSIRGLLESQDVICRGAPNVNLQLSHEIYWGTPGVPCDIAVLKHTHTYHVSPNDYFGAGDRNQRVNFNGTWENNPKFAPEKLRAELLEGAFRARKRLYAHRALPPQSIEFFCAAMVNFQGSMTPDIQRRQVCSWLFGIPSVYSGDLASLTEENIQTYRECFDIIADLNEKFDIYQNFQYSGVPEPTETDWHWWGKLQKNGEGAVVVIRGTEGNDTRRINIPWVVTNSKYKITARFSKTVIGEFTGQELIDGKLEIAIPVMGQEILEVALVH